MTPHELKRAQYAQNLASMKASVRLDKVPDPLSSAERPAAELAAHTVLVVLAALLSHVAVLGVFYGASAALRNPGTKSEPTPIQLTVREVVVKPEPPPLEEAPPKPVEKRPAKKTTRRPSRKRPPEPQGDPVPKKDPVKKVRRLVGLNLNATVSGGAGPSFQTGNTRLGRTAEVGEEASKEVLEGKPKAASSNRTSTRAPIGMGGVRIEKPQFSGPRLEPKYPEAYRDQALKARVTVEVLIGASGRVQRVKLITKPPNDAFRKEVLAVAKKQRWKPARQDGRPIEYTLTYTYNFNYSTQKE